MVTCIEEDVKTSAEVDLNIDDSASDQQEVEAEYG